MAGSSSSTSSVAGGKNIVEEASSIPFMTQLMEYVKNPKYVMMFIAAIMILAVGYMMYKKPDMINKLLGRNSPQSNPNANYVEEEEEEEDMQLHGETL